MQLDKTIKFLKAMGAKVPISQSRAGWVVSSCPLGPWRHENGQSHSGAFGVKKEPGDAFCNCFSCGYHGKMSELVLEARFLNKATPHLKVKWGELLQMVEDEEAGVDLDFDSPDIEERLFGDKKKLFPFAKWWLDTFPSWRDAPFARAYLKERSVPAVVADFLDLRADPVQRRVCVPVRDFAGTLMGLHGRAVDADADLRYRMYKYLGHKNTVIWLGEHWVDLNKPIVIVEGFFDLASVLRVYRNVVCPLYVNPNHDKLKRMADAMEWVTFFDSGKGGEVGRAKVAKFLSKDHLLEHVVPPSGCKDPGVMTTDQLVDVLADKLQLTALFV